MVDVIVVVELLDNVVPTWVPASPEHRLPTQATAHWNTLNVGDPDALDTVTEYDWATSAIVPELVTVDVWKVFVVKAIEVTDAFVPQDPAVTDSVPLVMAPMPAALAIGGRSPTPSSRTAAGAAVLHARRRVNQLIGGGWG